MALAYIGLGGNVGDRLDNIARARRGLALLPETVLLQDAPIYETRPVGGPQDQAYFYNSVSLIDTHLEPLQLLSELQSLERRVGRRREDETVRWGPRVLDLDILFYDDMVIEEINLVVPHPRMIERAFVLMPLADLDRDLMHPVLEMTISELLERMDEDDEGIHRISV